jgi:CHAD domain-containing protein
VYVSHFEMNAQVDNTQAVQLQAVDAPEVTFCFQHGEPLGPAIGRIKHELLDAIVAALEQREPNPDENVHDARQQLKKLRGLLRLVRGGIEPAAYARDNACFRDVGRSLAEAREAAAAMECVDTLLTHYDEQIPRREFAPIERALGALRAETVARVGESSVYTRAIEELRAAGTPEREWPLGGEGFELIERGLAAIYRGARRAYERAARDPSSENFHELRKLSKYHLHHVRLLEAVFPIELRARRKALDELNDGLGHLHDLDVLRALLDREKLEGAPLLQRLAFTALVDRRRAEVALDAEREAARLYAEKPGALVKRLRRYYELWSSANGAQPLSRSITA